MKKLHEKLKNMNEKNRKVFFLSVIVFSVLLILGAVGLTYAWFSATVSGNDTAKGALVETGILSIKYTNGNEIKGENILPGWTMTKTFTVENTGTVAATYKINWENITNTFVNKSDLVYTLTSTNSGGSLSETQIPNTGEHVNILNNITIPSGVTQIYTLTITYKNRNADQSSDMGKKLSGKIEVLDINGSESSGTTAADTIIAKYSANNTEGLIKVNQPATEQMKATTEYRYSGAGALCEYQGHIIMKYGSKAIKQSNECIQNMKICNVLDMIYTKIDEDLTESYCTTNGGTVSTINPTWDNGDVKNYVNFNNETWRIIGVFDVDDGTGNYEQRVKIVRDDTIEEPMEGYSWDSSIFDINRGEGINQWGESEDKDGNVYSGADLKTLLNTTYYNRTSSNTCYNNKWNEYTSCDFSEIGLNETARSMIDDAKWYTAGVSYNITTSTAYTEERSNALPPTGEAHNVSSYNDTIVRTKSWTGKVALIYPSDYGYASSICSNGEGYNSCKESNWLDYSGIGLWTLSPVVSVPNYAFKQGDNSSGTLVYADNGVRPVVYLKSNVKITGGTGADAENAYELSL